MRLPDREWARASEYEALLYFCQLVDDMIWYGSRDSYRAPSLNTYHRCLEILRSFDELRTSHLQEGVLSPMFAELLALGQSDPTIHTHFREEWAKLKFALKEGDIPTKVFAVRQLYNSIDAPYLKRCRDEIKKIVNNKTCKNKERLESLAGTFCSYILNVGHSSEQVRYALDSHFFGRDLEQSCERELNDFFAEFPCRTTSYDVFAFVTTDLGVVAQGDGCEIVTGKLPIQVHQRHRAFLNTTRDDCVVAYREIQAFDPSDARLRAEGQMALARAIAYTSQPQALFDWKTETIVAWGANPGGVKIDEAPGPLRRRYRTSTWYTDQVLDKRKQVVFEGRFEAKDRNRIANSIIAYSNAFHSESPSTQLTTVWSSLEGLLPAPSHNEGRIGSITEFALPCQSAMYLKNLFQWAFIDHNALGRDEFFSIIDQIPGYKSRLSKFIATLCFSEFEAVSTELGAFAARSPLTTYRGFRLHKAAEKISDLWKLVESHKTKVDWQLRRIYRERNRIIHQANPSPNVTTLILNLNEYFLVCLDTMFEVISRAPKNSNVDDVFTQIRLEQDYRESQVRTVSKDPLTSQNVSLVLGFHLE